MSCQIGNRFILYRTSVRCDTEQVFVERMFDDNNRYYRKGFACRIPLGAQSAFLDLRAVFLREGQVAPA